jgi:hypothetical protein
MKSCLISTRCGVGRADSSQTLQARRSPDHERSSAGPRRASPAPSACYGCANASACISRSAAPNHLSACRGEAASSSRRDARGTRTGSWQVLSYRCVGRCPRRRRTPPPHIAACVSRQRLGERVALLSTERIRRRARTDAGAAGVRRIAPPRRPPRASRWTRKCPSRCGRTRSLSTCLSALVTDRAMEAWYDRSIA